MERDSVPVRERKLLAQIEAAKAEIEGTERVRRAAAKIHLILSSSTARELFALCNSRVRQGGRLAVRSIKDFEALNDSGEQCERCKASLARLSGRKPFVRRS